MFLQHPALGDAGMSFRAEIHFIFTSKTVILSSVEANGIKSLEVYL